MAKLTKKEKEAGYAVAGIAMALGLLAVLGHFLIAALVIAIIVGIPAAIIYSIRKSKQEKSNEVNTAIMSLEKTDNFEKSLAQHNAVVAQVQAQMSSESLLHKKSNLVNDNAKNGFVVTYLPDTYIQDSSKSVVDDNGIYDFRHFSSHEAETVKKVIQTTYAKYPKDLQAIGMANESSSIVYKARSVLFDIIIVLYSNSDSIYDQFAVAIAYETKGAYFRKEALSYFEKVFCKIDPDFMHQFLHFSPLSVYSKFSRLYEAEHNYSKAIELTKIAWKYGDSNNQSFSNRISILESKLANPPKIRNRKVPQDRVDLAINIRQAALDFISEYNLQSTSQDIT